MIKIGCLLVIKHLIATQRAPTPSRENVENDDGPQTTEKGKRGELIEMRFLAGTCGDGGWGRRQRQP